MKTAPDFSVADRILQKALGDECFTAACFLVGRGERVLFRRAYGKLSADAGAPDCTEQTRFDLASVTKPLVVGLLTMRALESGRLCLWDRLDAFIDAPRDKAGINIKQILTHTAGFSTGQHLWKQTNDPARATELMLEAPLRSPPGTQVLYSCVGFILLGQLLECIYGSELAELAQREVFWPLKMQRTGYRPQGGGIAATEMQDDGRCLQGVVHDENARFLGGAAGNAGVFSTMDDLALYMQMLCLKGRLPDGSRYLSPASVSLMCSNHTEGMAQARGLSLYLPWYDSGYTGDLFPKETVGHTGFTGTSVTLDPTTGLFVVILTNRVCPSRDNASIHRLRRCLHNAVYAAACE